MSLRSYALKSVRRILGLRSVALIYNGLLRFVLSLNARLADKAGYFLSRQLLLVNVPEPAGLIDEIPSETTYNERRLLYNFHRSVWGGKDDVLEIGTFLGGTTRAIALGMLDNPSLDKTRKLICCDRFDTYYGVEELRSFMEPLVENGMLENSALEAFSDSTSFRALFDYIHSGQPYTALLEVSQAELPMLPDSSPPSRPLNIDKDRILGCIFIDGCKSWYALKDFMCTVLPQSKIGSYFLFQDYGMYTCFWIPVFLELFSDHFKLVAYVDGTYIFRMLSDPGRDMINSKFPETPQQLGWDKAEALFSAICHAAQKRGDEYGYTVGLLQKAGFAAYCGELWMARDIIDAMKNDRRFNEYASLIDSARRIPAYKPVSNGQRGDDPHWLGGQPIYL